jgi:acetylornithine deacetylase/succinyl-diaminopimelate desuccinylase-like protein
MKKYFIILICSYFVMLKPFELSAQNIGSAKMNEEYQDLARAIFRELIEINTTRDAGSTGAVQALVSRLKQAGFSDQDIHVAGPHPQHMNLVVHLRGSGKLSPVLFIGHLDVVEALKDDWSVDPFVFTEKDGWYYGRGTIDMKHEDADLIANLIHLKKEGFVPDRDIIVALTDDEEGGDFNGVQWLINNHRDLVNAEFCINPDGGGGVLKNGRHAMMDIQTSEKLYADYVLEVKNEGGHSSRPSKDNAIYHLAEALVKISKYSFPVSLNETSRMFLERSSAGESGQVKEDMLALAKNPSDVQAAARLSESPYYNSVMRTTCVATMLSGGHAENALPQTARANINCRMLPEDTPEKILSTLRSVIADTAVKITLGYSGTASPVSPLRDDVLKTFEAISAAMWPGVIVTPVMSTGATDGKYLRAAGIPVYGISGMFADISENRAHGRDERIGVSEFREGVEFMYRFMKAISKP